MQHRFQRSPTWIALYAYLSTASALNAQSLVVAPSTLNFSGVGDSPIPPAPQTIQLSSTTGENLPFMILGFNGLPYVSASPVSGTTPATITITPGTERPGNYQLVITFAIWPTSPPYPGSTALAVTLTYALPPPPVINSIVSAASFQPGPLAPGEIISIFGMNVASLTDTTTLYSLPIGSGWLFFPTGSGGTQVLFDGKPAPILYAADGQVNVVVPVELAGQASVNIVLSHAGDSPGMTLPLLGTAPAIFSASGKGSGQGAILNADSTSNSASNPAPTGSIIQIYAEGAGIWSGPGRLPADGEVDNLGAPYPVFTAPVSLTIGGQPAQILYAGQAPDLVVGILQVNAVIPLNISSGPQPVVLTVGSSNNATQGITVAVQ